MRTQSHTSWIFAQVDFLSGLLRTRFEASWPGLTALVKNWKTERALKRVDTRSEN